MKTTPMPVHPRAHSWRVMTCGGEDCRHPHLVLFDEHDQIIADAVIDRDAIDRLCNGLWATVAEIDAMKGRTELHS